MIHSAFAIGQAASVLKGGVERLIAADQRKPWYKAIHKAEDYLTDALPYELDRAGQTLRTPSETRAGVTYTTQRRGCSCRGFDPHKPCIHRSMLGILLILTACDDEAHIAFE